MLLLSVDAQMAFTGGKDVTGIRSRCILSNEFEMGSGDVKEVIRIAVTDLALYSTNGRFKASYVAI
jgi:hypothetical protein